MGDRIHPYVQIGLCRTIDRFPAWKRVLAFLAWKVPVVLYGLLLGLPPILIESVSSYWSVSGLCALFLAYFRSRYASPYGRVEKVMAPVPDEYVSTFMRRSQ